MIYIVGTVTPLKEDIVKMAGGIRVQGNFVENVYGNVDEEILRAIFGPVRGLKLYKIRAEENERVESLVKRSSFIEDIELARRISAVPVIPYVEDSHDVKVVSELGSVSPNRIATMVETIRAVQNIEEIIDSGVKKLVIGTRDLSLNLGKKKAITRARKLIDFVKSEYPDVCIYVGGTLSFEFLTTAADGIILPVSVFYQLLHDKSP